MCGEADIIVIERNYFGDTLTMMNFWKVRNKPIVAIFDDAYDIMHPQNISYNFWTNGELKFKDQEGNEHINYMKPTPLDQFKWGLQMVKGVQVPSVYLAKDWSKYNNTYHVHNFLDIDKYMNVAPLYPHPKDEIVIGWCGSMSHYASFNDSGIVQGLRRVASRFPKVKVLISGDRRLFELLDIKNKIFQPFVPADKWTPLLKTIDIGLCPLAGEYDMRRSWIKALEWMALKIPWVATNYPTYDELSPFGKMVENGYKNWAEALEEVVVNYDQWKHQAETDAYDYALEQSSDRNIEKVTLALYEKLIEEPYPLPSPDSFSANINFPVGKICVPEVKKDAEIQLLV